MNENETTQAVIPAKNAPVSVSKRPSLITSMAGKYNIDPAKFLDTLKATILPKASDEEMQAFCIVAHEYDLNPFLKEIHAFPNKSGGITPVVGVDGWCSLMNRRPEFDGIEFTSEDIDGKPHSVTAVIHIKGRGRPVRVTEYYSECQRNTDPWRQAPRRMLRHKALIQAARVAFGFSGIHDEDDAERMAIVTDVQPAPRPVFAQSAQALPAPRPTPPAKQAPSLVAPEPAAPAQEPAAAPKSPQEQLAEIVVAAGHNFDRFAAYCAGAGFALNGASSFDEVPLVRAKQFVSRKDDLLAAMAEENGGGK